MNAKCEIGIAEPAAPEIPHEFSPRSESAERPHTSYADVQSSSGLSAVMRAAVVTAPGRVEIVKTAITEPGPDQLLVRVEGCGVCASNLPIWEGKPWFTYPISPGAPGHEAWGRVANIGNRVRDFEKGDRVVIISSHAYAEYDICDAGCALKVPSVFNGQPMPGEPLGCAMNIFRRSKISKGDTVAIVGVGFLGALLTRLATATGACVIAVSRRSVALSLAKKMGAAHTVPLAGAIEGIDNLTNNRFCDVVIECTGKQTPLNIAGEITRERGRLVVAGYHQDGPREINMQLWNWRGLDVINAHERDPRVYVSGIRRALRAIETGILKPQPLYTHFFPLEKLGEALNAAASRPDDFIKAVITI
ncbi:MAG TPA: zinc-binding dehydrogenase [Candidatus Udaeobacter sp.]|nr:zinc-binding dehydrogenase [Candidatus Udaeobacter sp.]